MNGRVRYVGLGSAILGLALVWAAFGLPSNSTHAQTAQDPPLLEAMNTMNTQLRAIRRQARRADWDEASVEAAAEMVKAAVIAMNETPPMAETIPTDERQQFIIDYTKMSADLVKESLDLQIALLESRTDDILEHIEKLIEMQQVGHDKFMDE